MPLSDKSSHLSSDENENRTDKMWCEDLGKYKSDKTKHFQNGIHLLKSHHHQRNIFGQDGFGVESIVKEKTYIKLK